MRAVDTNVVLRFVLNDEPAQSALARTVIHGGAYLSHGALIEFVWVLTSRYRLARAMIADTLVDLLDMPSLNVADETDVRWAIARYRAGADFADMMHLVDAKAHGSFATFDARLARDAGDAGPVAIETL